MQRAAVLAALVSTATPARGAAQSLDPDEAELEVPTDSRGSLDSEADPVAPRTAERQAGESWGDILWRAKRVTLSHELGVQLDNPARIVSHRTGLRLEWSQSLAAWLFAGFDGKLFLFLPDDHRSGVDGWALRLFANLREAYLQVSVGRTSVKLGYQLVVWGESEGGVVTDIISPRDWAELLFPTLEDSRLGVPAVAVDQYTTAGTFSLVLVPLPLGDRMPERGSEYELDHVGNGSTVVTEAPRSIRDTEVGLRWRSSIGRADLALMAASVLDNRATLAVKGQAPDGSLLLRSRHRRHEMIGLAGALALGSWLLKTEAALKPRRVFQTEELRLERRNTVELSVGAEYGFADATLVAVEGGLQSILDWDESLARTRAHTPFASLAVMRDFAHETLRVFFLGISMPRDEVFMLKLYVTWLATDEVALVLDGGAVLAAPESLFGAVRGKHRVNFRIERWF